jgi:hypothetical protein
MKYRVRIKSIVVGLIAEMILTLGAGLVVGASILAYAWSKNLPLDSASFAEYSKSTVWFQFATLLGVIATVVSGFVTGWIARQDRLFNAFVMALITVLLSLAMIPFLNPYPFWFNVVAAVSTLIAGTLGGLWAEKALGERPPK